MTNEIGSGGISDNAMMRQFTDLQGWINQYIASKSDEVVLMVSGIPVNIKNHLCYVAWYKEGLDKGLLSAQEWYDRQTKMNTLTQLDIELNDVVLLFERKELQKMNHIKEIIDMNVAIIEKITDHHIYLNVITSKLLKHEFKLKFNSLAENLKAMYSVPPYENIIWLTNYILFYR